MRLFIAVLILIFSLQSWTKADDISDFEIEGISIGDNLLDYLDKTYVEKNKYFAVKGAKKYSSIGYFENLENYEEVMINFKSSDYEIGSLSAFVTIKNIEDCKITKNKIVKNISGLFLNTKSYETIDPYFQDPETIVYSTIWELDNGFVRVACYDWTEKSGNNLELRIDVAGKEFQLYLDEL